MPLNASGSFSSRYYIHFWSSSVFSGFFQFFPIETHFFPFLLRRVRNSFLPENKRLAYFSTTGEYGVLQIRGKSFREEDVARTTGWTTRV